MKSSIRDKAESKFHEAKGELKEIAGKVGMHSELQQWGIQRAER